ncbi:hypothetical protein G4B88_023126 [Cannabis sativa]|uniref:DUF4408 domain-containing protein n=1 Tax=Cannabis sativa TaxID=3483 RepID=A0A7J6G6H2_CANSA|nr:hypothetical protein G4B88_023126 [Cannabis sativa]
MTWMGSVKVMLISMGVVLVSLAMKVSVPLVKEFIIGSHVAVMWSSIATWLKPPYLYIIINGIIITIVASSRLHQNHHHDDRVDTEPGRYPMTNGSSRQANSDYGFYVESNNNNNNKIISSEFGALEQIRPRPLYQQREKSLCMLMECVSDAVTFGVPLSPSTEASGVLSLRAAIVDKRQRKALIPT